MRGPTLAAAAGRLARATRKAYRASRFVRFRQDPNAPARAGEIGLAVDWQVVFVPYAERLAKPRADMPKAKVELLEHELEHELKHDPRERTRRCGW